MTSSLTTRLQEATGPDRELDAAIGLLSKDWRLSASGTSIWFREHGDNEGQFSYLFMGKRNAREEPPYSEAEAVARAAKCSRLKPYTASVDAALELVERKLPGVEFELGTTYGPARVELGVNMDGGPYYAERLDGNIPLTILQALISALSNQGEKE